MTTIFIFIWVLGTALLVSCAGDDPFSESAPSNFSNYIVVASVRAGPNSGPGLITLFDSSGNVVRVLQDYYETAEFASGLSYFQNNQILAAVNGTDRVDAINLISGAASIFASHAQINSNPLRQIATLPDGSTWINEGSTDAIEKVTVDGSRSGNPFISASTGACTINDPYGVVYISSLDAVGVVSRAGGGMYSVFDTDGGCITQVSGAPFNSGQPTGLAYHEDTDRIIVTFATGDEIYSLDPDGTNATLAFSDTSVIDTPRPATVDANGFVYIGSDTQDTVEKFNFDGSVLTRATSGPIIGPGIYSQNPTAILVIP